MTKANDSYFKELACDFLFENIPGQMYQEVRAKYDKWLSENNYHKNKMEEYAQQQLVPSSSNEAGIKRDKIEFCGYKITVTEVAGVKSITFLELPERAAQTDVATDDDWIIEKINPKNNEK